VYLEICQAEFENDVFKDGRFIGLFLWVTIDGISVDKNEIANLQLATDQGKH
jgi:hypothetical protein